MNAHKHRRSLLILCVAAGLVPSVTRGAEAITGQPTFGSVRGVTMAPGGLPLAEVNVVLRNLADSTSRQLVSDSKGVFTADDLRPGSYQIVAFKEGFTTPAPATVEIAQNQVAKADVALAAAVTSAASQTGVGRPDVAPLTEREKQLLDRIDRLEGRLAAMEAKGEKPFRTTTPDNSTGRPPSALADTAASPSIEKPKPTEVAAALPPASPAAAPVQLAQNQVAQAASPAAQAPAAPAVDNQTPFAYGDFTWLNGTSRNKDVAVDTPFFTPEVRFDTHFMTDFNQPIDHTMGGATESFRSGEFQVEQASVGGDFHWQNVRGRINFMQGLFASTTPRNDATPDVGQWDLRSAYKYVSEAWGGYHFNVNHGLNVDAGIFVSYIGLFSYYNFDNWTYQPSYVSSNTPWFFNGLRIQWFPTNKLKIEPWIINGWQSYARANGHHGFGGQILWRPKEWLSMVFNNYGNGTDAVGAPSRVRIHTDDSIEIRYYNKPESTNISKMAFSFTGDLGCEYGKGGGTSCTGKGGQPKQAFMGWMVYNRMWFHKDLLGLTLGGGMMTNPGRYLTMLPPINGANAFTGSPYLPESPGSQAHMWDSTVTLQYMPKQYITWWAEVGYRHSDIPYFSGRGGITPPGGNNGAPASYVCTTGATAGTGDLATAQAACGGASNVWFPDLRRSQANVSVGVMVKF